MVIPIQGHITSMFDNLFLFSFMDIFHGKNIFLYHQFQWLHGICCNNAIGCNIICLISMLPVNISTPLD